MGERIRCVPFFWLTRLLFLAVFLFPSWIPVYVVGTEGETQDSVATEMSNSDKCLTEEDLDFETCNVEDLSIPALKSICERVGLHMEQDIFTYIFDEIAEEIEGEAAVDPNTKEWSHIDYVSGAYECLLIEQESHDLLGDEFDEAAADEMLTDDPELLAEYVAEMLNADPGLVKDLEEELKQDDPELWAAMESEFEEGEMLKDRPDILAQVLSILINEEPEIFNHLVGEEGIDAFESEL